MAVKTKAAALYDFFNSFGIPAYERCRVKTKAVPPYITYDYVTSSFEEGEVSLTVDLWFYTPDNREPDALAERISAAIGRGGVQISCAGGMIWLKRGSPFCQAVRDPTDDRINRRYINITAEYITAD